MAPKDKTKGEVSDLKAKLAAVIKHGTLPAPGKDGKANGTSKGKGGSTSMGSSAPKDPQAIKRGLFKSILHYMTINVDMSGLFTQMIIASTPTNDIVLKKMLYLYICTYAQQKPDLTLLAVNTLTKDCGDSDPTVRGLALRSLCSLRVPNLVEYLITPLKTALNDRDAYVRRTAVLGVLKVFRLDAKIVEELELEQKLKEMFANDTDSQVVANALSVLQQIVSSPQDLITKAVVYSLLNRLKEFSEWSQCAVLEFVSNYRPENGDETFDIMNVLEDRLQHSNSALVLATIKVFLHLTVEIPDIHQQVLERIRGPLFTMMHNKGPEISYTIASHLRLLVERAPMLFSQDFKQFYCRYNDSIHVKKLKLEMLTVVADEANAYDIVNEICEYATDPNETIARESIKAVGTIAMNLRTADGLVERLLSFLDMNMDHVTAETYIVMADILRCLPEHADKCIDALAALGSIEVVKAEARSAMVWILGSYGEKLQEAPYILEKVGHTFEEEEECVQLSMLTAVTKLFFKRAPECHRLLVEVLEKGAECANQDVHDRALFYFRLLKRDINQAQQVVGLQPPTTVTFSEQLGSELKDTLFREFNSLSALYNEPASVFVADDAAEEITYYDEEDLLYEEHVEESQNLLDFAAEEATSSSSGAASAAAPTPAAAAAAAPSPMSLLDDLASLSVEAPAPPAPAREEIRLNASPSMDAGRFQQLWGSLANQDVFTVSPGGINVQDLTSRMRSQGILTMASGGQEPMYKLYQYAQLEGSPSSVFLVEMIANTQAGTLTCTCKTDPAADLKSFSAFLTKLLT